MKRFTIVLALILTAVALLGQRYKPPHGSPDEVLDKYFAMINQGALLTPEGWKKAAALFVHERPTPRDSTVFVTTAFPLGNGPMDIHGSHAEAWQKWVDDLGAIDSALHYKPPPKPSMEIEGVVRLYKLILTNRHWVIGADGKPEEEVTGEPEWRIEGALDIRSASKNAAIRYLKQMRAATVDPVVAANADKTLAILQRLPVPRGHI